MSFWIIDIRDKIGQQVSSDAVEVLPRFCKVEADTIKEAFTALAPEIAAMREAAAYAGNLRR